MIREGGVIISLQNQKIFRYSVDLLINQSVNDSLNVHIIESGVTPCMISGDHIPYLHLMARRHILLATILSTNPSQF